MAKVNFFKKWVGLTIILLSFIFAGWQMIYLAKNQSVTTDEKVHVPSGFSYWQFKNYYLNPEHPPLAKLLVGLPVYLQQPYYPDTTKLFDVASRIYYDSWAETRTWGEKFFYNSSNDLEKIIYTSRAVNIILTLALILFIAFWAFKVSGLWGAVLSAVLATFTPLLLAHGSLANTDILITLEFTILSFCWWKYLKVKNWKWFILSSVLFGLCAVSKFSFIAFIPVLFLTSLTVSIKQKNIKIGSAILKGLVFAFITWLIVMAFYGFSFRHAPEFTGFVQKDILLNPLAIKAMKIAGQTLIPIWYFKGLFMVLAGALGGRGAYLMGDFSQIGWWYYFPITIILKTPIGFLLLLVWATAWVRKFLKKDFVLQIVLLGGVLIYLIVAMVSKTNLGQRHIMPIYPLLIIFISQITIYTKAIWQKVILVLMVVGIILSVAANYKNQIAYFNEFVGVKNGYNYLLDSNYDWGQSMASIGNYLKEKNFNELVYVDYEWESPGEIEFYKINALNLSDFNPNLNSIIVVSPGNYMLEKNSWLSDLEVIDRIDNTVFVLRYNIDGS